MTPQYITIHNTANDASADNEYKFMTSTNAKSTTGWHIVVDDVKAIYAVPLNRNSFHAGDGANGTGNRKSIGIEICYSIFYFYNSYISNKIRFNRDTVVR